MYRQECLYLRAMYTQSKILCAFLCAEVLSKHDTAVKKIGETRHAHINRICTALEVPPLSWLTKCGREPGMKIA